jgi:DNA-binding YbaB/EbfC family protein
MAGVGKLLKQAQKMQRSIEALQTQLEAKVIDVTSGGGAVKLSINGAGKFTSLTLDPEFLKEEAKLVSDTLLVAMQDAAKQAKEYNDAEMAKITSAFQVPGGF